MKWTKEKVLNELNVIIAAIGHYPSFDKLQKMGRSGLASAVIKHGGSCLFRELTTGEKRKPPGYWLNIDNVIFELRHHFGDLIERGVMPTAKMLVGKIPSSIFSNFGIEKLSEALNCRVSKRWLSRDGHLLQSYAEYLLDEYLYSIGVPHEPNVVGVV